MFNIDNLFLSRCFGLKDPIKNIKDPNKDPNKDKIKNTKDPIKHTKSNTKYLIIITEQN